MAVLVLWEKYNPLPKTSSVRSTKKRSEAILTTCLITDEKHNCEPILTTCLITDEKHNCEPIIEQWTRLIVCFEWNYCSLSTIRSDHLYVHINNRLSSLFICRRWEISEKLLILNLKLFTIKTLTITWKNINRRIIITNKTNTNRLGRIHAAWSFQGVEENCHHRNKVL